MTMEKRGKKRRKKDKPRSRREKGKGEIPFPELLAPAGNLETFFAAVEEGADAVYLGLGEFNARKRGENFSLPDLGKLVPFAHSRGVKVYLTLNSQILEGELPRFIDMVHGALLFDPDALILSDLGAIRIVRRYFPKAEIHASTLMGNCNSRVASVLHEMGVARLVVERHLEMEELKSLVRRSPIGVEVFVHGALCFSLSGRCLFSSYLGGKSGNRGECVQPCRRVYDAGGVEAPFFSARDLCLIDVLPDLVRLGVAALKIEGRLRSVEYVRNVVRAYRRALDRIRAGEPERGVEEGKAILGRVIGRPSTKGVLGGERERSVVSSEEEAAVGEFLGRVQEVSPPYVRIEGDPQVSRGERLRVQDGETGKGVGFTASVVSVRDGAPWVKVPLPVKPGDMIFRVGSSRERREETARAVRTFASLPSAGHTFEVTIRGSAIVVEGRFRKYGQIYRFRVSGAGRPLELSPPEVEGLLAQAYRGDIPLSEVRVRIEGEPEVSLEEVLRAFDDASRAFDRDVYLEGKSLRVKIIRHLRLKGSRRERRPLTFSIAVDSVDSAREFLDRGERIILSLRKSHVRNPDKLAPLPRERVFIRLPLAQTDQGISFYRRGLETLSRMGFRKFVVPDLGWFRVFREARIRLEEVISDHYLYVFNTSSAIALEDMGVKRFILPLELTLENLRKMGKYLRGLGIFTVFTRVPLLKSPLIVFPGEGEKVVRSRFDEEFVVRFGKEGTEIFSSEYFCAVDFIEEVMKAGVSDFLIDLSGLPVEEGRRVVDNILKGKGIEGSSAFNLTRKNF
ncbi:MAG: U32 family peptidase [Deltaproteobacteria bacterium]|nr:MAG: U32 family peptidase [Deltaproteobacteria bacterium]